MFDITNIFWDTNQPANPGAFLSEPFIIPSSAREFLSRIAKNWASALFISGNIKATYYGSSQRRDRCLDDC